MAINNNSSENVEIMSQTLRAMSHPNRIIIINLLSKCKRLSVGDISEKTGFAQPLVSHHVLDMHSKGLLSLERDGRNAYYSLKDVRIMKILKIASDIESA
ncbi:MAG: metalloregulator ArsR/SmtB family transcription factor [Bacteroidales bacterium]|nr:metalloregulator ArsR/SmtB family transcription factor [Bacteroidales bacterium]